MDAQCANISLSKGSAIPWVDEIKYSGVCILQSHTFKCSLANHRRSFYRSANAIFGNIGRMASEEVVLQLIKSRPICIPTLLHEVEACALTKSELFRTNNIGVVKSSQSYFGLCLPSEIWA